MTVTAETTNPPQLTDHDYILATDEEQPWLSTDYALRWALGVNLHVRPEMPIRVCLYETERRVVVRLGATCADVDLYADADQLDRLITLLTAARQRLP